ncbi:discoidin domain-containing protein [Roseivirga sp. BDSF3-8]|uniref:discoidin domain-containing protein n=1 Tax=Roseivirga sp. BDSF3-8 TaxID=3241598 RepID=UPI003532539D
MKHPLTSLSPFWRDFSIRTKTIVITLSLIIGSCFYATAQNLIWEENFDGTTLDPEVWTYDVGVGVWNWGNNQELQLYTDRSENVYLENGNLVIQALRENREGYSFTSGRVKTEGRVELKYGIIEARIKMPDLANGLWPAFWLLGSENVWPASGELDIVEMGTADAIAAGKVNNRVGATAHWDYEGNYAGYGETYDAAADLSQDYHIYKMYWDSTVVKGYIDDVEYWSFDISPSGSSLEEFKTHPYFIILNLAVGGIFPDIYDPAGITAPLPAKMYVDYVRVYEVPGAEIYTPGANSYTGTFGIYTENTPVDNSLTFGTDADLFLWNNLTATTTAPYEGSEVMSFRAEAGNWFGMGIASDPLNMSAFSDGYLRMHVKTTSTATFDIGVSSGAGDSFITFVNGENLYGLVRDGQWHEVAIPLNAFNNVDFVSVSQPFMFKGDPPGAPVEIAFDNVYWEEGPARPVPTGTNFGILTETASVASELSMPQDADIFVWENTLQEVSQAPYEGSESLAYTSAPGLAWFGMGIKAAIKHDLSGFADGSLHFALKTSSTTPFSIGMKSGNVDGIGQGWVEFRNGSDPYGFVRDGQWHLVEIPLSDFSNVDLTAVNQFFQLLGTEGAIGNIEIDDIYIKGTSTGSQNPDPDPDPETPVNIALNKPATSSSSEGAGLGAANAVDGDLATRWSSNFSDPQWIQVDLQNTYDISSVALQWEAAAAASYRIEVSADGSNWNQVYSTTSGDGGLDSLSLSGTGRYIRMYGTSRTTPYGYSLYEFRVYGTQGSTTPPSPPATTCTGNGPNSTGSGVDYTYELDGKTLTFKPARAGVGSNLVILYLRKNSSSATFPGYALSADGSGNFVSELNAVDGDQIDFYYTYSVPEGGERNSAASYHEETVGQCGSVARLSAPGTPADTFEIFPNPALNQLTVRAPAGNDKATILILGADGRHIRTHTLNSTQKRMDVSQLQPGLYFLRIICQEGTTTKSWVKE